MLGCPLYQDWWRRLLSSFFFLAAVTAEQISDLGNVLVLLSGSVFIYILHTPVDLFITE
jgi:hypothetical protein